MTSIITVRSQSGPLDIQQVANATGAAASVTSSPRLATESLSQIAWIAADLDVQALTDLAASMRAIFTGAEVLAIVIDTATLSVAASEYPADHPGEFSDLQYQRQRGSIAQ